MMLFYLVTRRWNSTSAYVRSQSINNSRHIERCRTRFSLSLEIEQANAGPDGRTGLARPNSPARANEDRQRNIMFLCLADHVKGWQPYPRLIHTLLYICDGLAYALRDIRTTATVLVALLSSPATSTNEGPREQ